MAVNEIFKTEFRGYSKNEVAEYIMALNAQMESLKAELDNAESQLTKCRNELDEFRVVEQSVREPSADEIESIRQSVREELEPVIRREVAAQLEEKYKTVLEQCVREDREKNGQYREKAEAYDAQRDMLADLMIKAKSDAQEICDDAKSKADTLLSDAFDKYDKMRSDFETMQQNITASKNEMDKRIAAISHYLDDFSQYLNFMGTDIQNTADNFKENM